MPVYALGLPHRRLWIVWGKKQGPEQLKKAHGIIGYNWYNGIIMDDLDHKGFGCLKSLGGLDWKQNRKTSGHGRGQIIGSTWNRPELLETVLKKWMPWIQRSEWSEVFPLFPLFMDHQNNLKNFEDPKAVVQCVPCCPMFLFVFACFRMFPMVPQSFSSLVPNLVAEVPKDQAVFQKAKGCQEGSLGSLGSLNDAAMAGKKSAGSALGSMHQVRPSPGLYHFLVSMVSKCFKLFISVLSVIFSTIGKGEWRDRGHLLWMVRRIKFLALCIVQALRTWTLSKIFVPFVKSWEKIFGTSGGLTWVASQFENKAKTKDTFLLK